MSDDLNDYAHGRQPTSETGNLSWKIVRAPAGREMKLICYSHDMLWLDTHFYLGRTGPHRKLNCTPCKFQTPIREKGYLLCQDGPTGQSVVFEFTPPAFKALEEARLKYQTLRGCQLNISRAGTKGNSRVIVTVKGSITLPAEACQSFSVWPILAKIWCLRTEPGQGLPPNDDIHLGEDGNVA